MNTTNNIKGDYVLATGDRSGLGLRALVYR